MAAGIVVVYFLFMALIGVLILARGIYLALKRKQKYEFT